VKLYTLTSLLSCFTRLAMADLLPVVAMVNRALSMLSPTARDSMLAPARQGREVR